MHARLSNYCYVTLETIYDTIILVKMHYRQKASMKDGARRFATRKQTFFPTLEYLGNSCISLIGLI